MNAPLADDGSDPGLLAGAAPEERGDRRRWPRRPASERRDLTSVRVRPGISTRLADLSRSGAALDVERRLVPGRFVHVQLFFVSAGVTMRARVVRSQVAQLSAGRVVYRCAVQFDRLLGIDGGDPEPP